MVVGSCDIVSELLGRGLENIVVKILDNTDVHTVTACLQVNSSWCSNLQDIWRLILREKQKNKTSFRQNNWEMRDYIEKRDTCIVLQEFLFLNWGWRWWSRHRAIRLQTSAFRLQKMEIL